jgi:hypothetical protein
MVQLSIQVTPSASNDPCGLCGTETATEVGPRLSLAGREVAVCHRCGQKYAPALAALLALAQVASRVGTIGRHTVVPPMEALLDLAHAAENFTHSMSNPGRQAA